MEKLYHIKVLYRLPYRHTDKHECLLLVVADKEYNNKVPILLGTNVISYFLNDCKEKAGEQFLQRANLHVPWFLAFRCLHIRKKRNEKEL